MLNVQKRSERFFGRKVFFSFCSTGHLKRSSDKFAEYFWPKVQKGLKVYPKKRNSFFFSPDTRKAVTNKMPKISTQHPTEWFVPINWTIKISFPKIAISFSFRARREQFWHLYWVFFGKQRKIFPQNPENSFEPQTRRKISSKIDSGHVQRSPDKPVVNLWPKERIFFSESGKE